MRQSAQSRRQCANQTLEAPKRHPSNGQQDMNKNSSRVAGPNLEGPTCKPRHTTIHTKTITNENPGICFRFLFRNGKAQKFPQIFFCIWFRSDHVGHAQATTAGHTYENKNQTPEIFFRFCFCNPKERKS